MPTKNIQDLGLVFHLVPYKNKHFYYSDWPDELFGSDGEVNEIDITDGQLEVHAQACAYYGIPMYTGRSVRMRNRCRRAWSKFYKYDLEQ